MKKEMIVFEVETDFNSIREKAFSRQPVEADGWLLIGD
jgi:hypothetical protein